MPSGLTSVVVFRAYHEIVTPRPPGNIHGAQRCTVHRLPLRGETLTTTVQCESKEEKKGRKFVYLKFETCGEDGKAAFTSDMTSIVAR